MNRYNSTSSTLGLTDNGSTSRNNVDVLLVNGTSNSISSSSSDDDNNNDISEDRTSTTSNRNNELSKLYHNNILDDMSSKQQSSMSHKYIPSIAATTTTTTTTASAKIDDNTDTSNSNTNTSNTNNTNATNSNSNTNIIYIPNEYDIICIKDKTWVYQKGNIIFRSKILYYSKLYEQSNKINKMILTKTIVESMKNEYNTRFLTKKYYSTNTNNNTTNNNNNNNSNFYYEIITDKQARDKVTHSFRFISKSNNKQQQPNTNLDRTKSMLLSTNVSSKIQTYNNKKLTKHQQQQKDKSEFCTPATISSNKNNKDKMIVTNDIQNNNTYANKSCKEKQKRTTKPKFSKTLEQQLHQIHIEQLQKMHIVQSQQQSLLLLPTTSPAIATATAIISSKRDLTAKVPVVQSPAFSSLTNNIPLQKLKSPIMVNSTSSSTATTTGTTSITPTVTTTTLSMNQLLMKQQAIFQQLQVSAAATTVAAAPATAEPPCGTAAKLFTKSTALPIGTERFLTSKIINSHYLQQQQQDYHSFSKHFAKSTCETVSEKDDDETIMSSSTSSIKLASTDESSSSACHRNESSTRMSGICSNVVHDDSNVDYHVYEQPNDTTDITEHDRNYYYNDTTFITMNDDPTVQESTAPSRTSSISAATARNPKLILSNSIAGTTTTTSSCTHPGEFVGTTGSTTPVNINNTNNNNETDDVSICSTASTILPVQVPAPPSRGIVTELSFRLSMDDNDKFRRRMMLRRSTNVSSNTNINNTSTRSLLSAMSLDDRTSSFRSIDLATDLFLQ